MASRPNPLILKLQQSGVLSDEDYPVLLALCTAPRTIPAETVLVAQGDKTSGLHLVLSGFAYRYKILPNGGRQIIGILLPGDFCDLQAAILRRSDHTIATLTECAVVQCSQSTVDDLTLARSRIARALWWSTLVDESILREWLARIGRRSADQRIAHFFCELMLRLKVVDRADGQSCELPLTQEKIGDVLGISNVHVNRVLQNLRGRDLLQFDGRRLTVPDLGALAAFCDFEPDYLHLAG